MQSVYSPYELSYTQLVPQHILVNSPQVGSQFFGFEDQDSHHQVLTPMDYEQYADPVGMPRQHQHQHPHQQHQHQHAGLEQQMHGLSLQGELSNGEDYFRDGQLQFQQRAPPQTPHQFNNEGVNGGVPNHQAPTGVPAGYEYPQMIPTGDFNSAPSRTVYLGNVPQDITAKELLDHVRSGVVENMRILPEKMCAFISFLDESSALLFHSDAILKRLTIKDNDIKIGWGRNAPLSPLVLASVQRDGATRNVYFGALPKDITEEQLRDDLSSFGVIDTVKILNDKGVAFVHFCSISSAIKVVTSLSEKNDFYADKKIFYGKDRCAFITKTQQHNAAQYLGLAPGMEHLVTNADREFISSTLLQQSAAAAAIATTAGGANNLGNRTVYLGNLPKDVKVEEICNVVRGGLLQTVKYLQDRHVCFITFIDPIAAAQFYAMAQIHGLTIHNKRIKIGWGKHSGPLSNALTLAVSSGASRNIYIGNIDPQEPKFSKEALRVKFTEFGDIEQINYLVEKNCVFVNFTSISNAILAIDKIKIDEDFKELKINFGKDRCGNIPRQFVNNNGNNSNGGFNNNNGASGNTSSNNR